MKKWFSITVLCVAVAFTIAFLCLSLDKIADVYSPVAGATTSYNSGSGTTDNKNSFIEPKTIRDATISCCVFAIGLFAIVFEIGKKDRYGHSLKQEYHFELCYIYRKAVAAKWGFVRRSIPVRFLVPYPVYLLLIVASAVLCVMGQSSSLAIYALCTIFVLSFLFMVCYTLYVLYVMYGQEWMKNKVKQICQKTAGNITKESVESSKLKLASQSMRLLVDSGTSCPNDFIDIHKASMTKLWEYLSADALTQYAQKNKEFLFDIIQYYETMMTSVFISAADTGDVTSANIKTLVNDVLKAVDCTAKNAKDHPLFLIAGIASCKALNDSVSKNKVPRKLFSNIDEKAIASCVNTLYYNLNFLYRDNRDQTNTIARALYRLHVKKQDSCLSDGDQKKYAQLCAFAQKFFASNTQREDSESKGKLTGVNDGQA